MIGGLLVARYVGLDSAHQGTEQALIRALGDLNTAKDRAGQADAQLVQFEAEEFLAKSGVLNAINAGITDITKLVGQGPDIPLTVEQLKPFVEGAVAQFGQAERTLDEAIPAFHEVNPAERGYLHDLGSVLCGTPC